MSATIACAASAASLSSGIRRLAVVCLACAGLLAGSAASAQTPPAPAPRSLPEMAAWDLGALNAAVLRNVVVVNNGFSGKLHVDGLADDLAPELVGFKTDAQRLYTLALIYPGKTLLALLPALRQSALGDADLPQVLVLLTPPANAGARVVVPLQVGNVRLPYPGGTSIALDAGVRLLARARFSGPTAALLKAVGAPAGELLVSGKIDARTLVGAGLSSAALHSELVNASEFRVTLRPPALERQPAYLAFGDSVLLIKGVAGKFAAGIATSATIKVGSGVHFERVTINRDPATAIVSIASSSVDPGAAFLTLPVAGAAIRQLVFQGTLDEKTPANDKFSVDGQYVVGGSAPRDFSARLSGGAPAQYLVTVHADTTLGQLLGWSAPGLDALVLKDVTFGNNLAQGRLSVKGVNFSVVLFKTPAQNRYNAAFLADAALRLPQLTSALSGSPLADLELTRPVFVLVPPENAAQSVKLPETVFAGMAPVELKPGLNLFAQASSDGALADLLRGVGLSTSKIVLSGSLDPALLAGGDARLSDAVINATSLQALLPVASPTRKPPYLSFGSSVLTLSGVSGKIAASVATSAAVNVGSGLRFEQLNISREPLKRQLLLHSTLATSGANFATLPIAGALIRNVALSGVIDEQNPAKDAFTLAGQFAVGGGAAHDFTAALSGGTPAEYLLTVHTDTPLAQVLGWTAPGLEAAVLSEVAFGKGTVEGRLMLRGLPFRVIAFKGAGQAKANAAFLCDETFSFPKLVGATQGTPLADLELARPGFILVPPENGSAHVSLPDGVARHVGAPALDLKKGLNLIANGNAYGELAALLEKLSINSKGLPITGSLDPLTLASVDLAALAQSFLDALDLRVELPKFALPGVGQPLSVSKAYLAVKGITRGIDAHVGSSLALALAGESPIAFDTTLRLVKTTAGSTVELSGAYPGLWNRPLGIGWLNVRNVTLAGSFSATANTLALLGTTDVGSVRNLRVTLDLATRAAGAGEMTLLLSGADLSLANIPPLAAIPHSGDLKLRDVLLSTHAVGGTLKSVSVPLLDGVQTIAFELAGHWNLAALLREVKLPELLPLPSFARPLLGRLQLGRSALLLATTPIDARLADLPPAAQTQLLAIYGTAQAGVRAVAGVNLITLFDPAPMGPALTAFLPAGQKLVLQGSVGGVLGGGPPSLALAATIPALALPSSLAFVKLPHDARTSFFVNLTPTAASAGLGVNAIISARLNQQNVDFDSTIAFELDSLGGVAVDLQGRSLAPWRNPLGISGLTLEAGTRLEFKSAASSEQTLKFLAKTHIGSRAADVAGSASLLGGVVDQGAFEIKVSELALSDVLALFNDAVTAGGGQPLKADFPAARLTDVDIAFASPGASAPEIGLPNGGTRLAGDLWFLVKGKPLTRAKAQISETRLTMSGDIADFTLGPLSMKGNRLDIRAQTMPPLPPQFRIAGDANFMNRHAAGEIDAGLAETALVSSLDLGALLDLDVHASFATPAAAGLDPAALLKQDMALNARLKSDLGAWLRDAGATAVAKVFAELGGDVRKLAAGIDVARAKVDGLDEQIRKARARADAGAQTVDQQIVLAQKKVDDLAGRVNALKSAASAQKHDIHGCNYKREICYWWNWGGHCTRHKDIPDIPRDLACEASNVRHAATLAADEAALKAAEAAKAAADAVLSGLRKGEKGADLASLDPEVIVLEAAQLAARLALEAAKKLAQGAELASDQLAAGLKSVSRLDSFALTGSSISGRLQKAANGKPVVLGLDFTAVGQAQHLRLAYSLNDPAYNARQLETLALLVGKAAVEALPGAAPVLKNLLGEAFSKAHNAASSEVDKALKDNGLD